MPPTPLIQALQQAAEEALKSKSMQLITPEQLDAVTATLSKDRCGELAELLNELCGKYGIVEPAPFRMFLANLLQESAECAYKSENLSYSAKRIHQLFPARFPTLQDALPYEHNPREFGNKLYGGRYGNRPGTDDGYNLRGGGYFGLTFYNNWKAYADYKGMTVEQASDHVRETDEGAMDSACWFFSIFRKLIPVAKTGDFKKVCKLINGGLIGYDVRLKYYDKINSILH